MYEGTDTLVLHDELAIEESLPFAWRPLHEPLTVTAAQRYAESNLRMLQTALALDDSSAIEKSEEPTAQTAETARLDMKLNLLLDLMGRLLAQNQPRPAPRVLRFNARGAEWRAHELETEQVRPGASGVLELFLRDCLVEPLRIEARVERITRAGDFDVRFVAQPDAVANLIDKFIFRLHRRRVADTRKPKRA